MTETTDIQIVHGSALEHLNRSEIDTQISTAKKYPRSIKDAMARMGDLATVNRATAESTYYRLPRREWNKQTQQYEDKIIEGPSVRMAEIAVSGWGNLRFGSRVVEIGVDRVTAQGFCHDLETNNACAVEVTAGILTSKGNRYPEHMITTTANAAAAKALRNAVFRIVPRSYVDQVVKKCKDVALGKGMTMLERWRDIAQRLSVHGATEKELLAALSRKGVADVTTDDILHLIGLATAIEDGELSISQALRPQAVESGVRSDVADIIRDGQQPTGVTVGEDLSKEEAKRLDALDAERQAMEELAATLSVENPEAVEKVMRNAPDNRSAAAELRRMAAALRGGSDK